MDEIKLELLKTKRETIFSHINTLYDSSKKVSPQETRNQEDFLAQTSNLDRLYDQFNTINDEFNQCSMQGDPDFMPNYKVWLAFEDLYSRLQHVRSKVLESRIIKSQPNDASTSSNTKPPASIKLPPIEIPSFDGKQENWELFYNSFKTNVHDNFTLTNAQRIQYLVGRLSGQARTVLVGTIPNEENYVSIWNSLIKKYQDKRAIGTFYLNSIFDSKSVTGNVNNLNEFVERFAASKTALEQLDIDNLTDFVFVHIALKKLDAPLVQSFEMSVRDKEIPACSDLIEYLRHQVKIMQRTNSNTRSIAPSNSRAPQTFNSMNANARNKTSHTFAITANNKITGCNMCQKKDHYHIYECPQFKALAVNSRFAFIKDNKYCTNCLSSRHTHSQCNSKSRCRSCQQTHHSLLHFETRNPASVIATTIENPHSRSTTHAPQNPPSTEQISESVTAVALSPLSMQTRSKQPIHKASTTILLSTAQVYAYSASNEQMTIRCLVDSASQHNLISLQCCENLNLSISPLQNSVIKTVGSISTPTIGYVSMTIKSRIADIKYTINLIVVERLTENLPTEYVDSSAIDHIIGIPMADETWNIPVEIDALLGAQLFPYLLLGGRVMSQSSVAHAPPALETTLGYIIMGEVPISQQPVNLNYTFGPLIANDTLHAQLNKFWELEELPTPCLASADDIHCENLYTSNVKREENGRYTVSLPFKHEPSLLGNSYVIAKRRFASLERRFKSSPNLRHAYNKVITSYLEEGYISEINHDENTINNGYFIPHHAVLRPDKSTTQCRIVLDASAKTDTGYSLNDLLYTGPNLQADLFTLLLNFRLFAIAISADIQQMYLRISLIEEHRKFQKFLFRFCDSEPLRTFQFNSIAFGLRSSPFLAMRTVRELASDERARFPLASNTASRELYMDDLTSSVMSVKEGIILAEQLLQLFHSGGFNLLKWSSNSSTLLASLPESHRVSVEFSNGDNLKILGMKWLPVSDNFGFTTSKTDEGCTKRIILSTIARLFDVLGLVAPVILYAKLLIQELWLANMDWDELPPHEIVQRFTQFKAELPLLSKLAIPRHLGVMEGCTVNLVAFGDASLKAYGCAVYLHIIDTTGNISFNLVCSKSKVAPLKTVSLARLELCAALLLSQLVSIVYKAFNERYKIANIYAFSDSTIALCWIHSSPHRWQIFVANRVAKIHENLPAKYFYHINGNENPSDCLSRGLLPSQLETHPLWWVGPPWIRAPASEWPVEPFSASKYVADVPEVKSSTTLVTTTIYEESLILTLSKKFSSWNKLLRIVVYILRFSKKTPACYNH